MTSSLRARWDHFWFEASYLPARLTTFRVAFFGLLALDLWMLMVPHAPRYGAGAFNVTHVAPLQPYLPVPTAPLVTALYLVAGFVSLAVALGVGGRRAVLALTAIYGGVYFWSQADSYQHHYLIVLLLLVSAFLPLERTAGVDAGAAPADAPVRAWAARLIYAQVAVVYLFTAITKLSPFWLDGATLQQIIQVEGVRDFQARFAGWFGQEEAWAYAVTAWSIMLWQFLASAAFLVPKLRPIACLTGPVFHIMVEVIELKIGWFSYYMIALYYILLFPDRWFLALGRPVGWVLRPLRRAFTWAAQPRPIDGATRWVLWAGATAGVGLWVAEVPVDGAGLAAVLAAAFTAAVTHPGGAPRARLRAAAMVLCGGALWASVTLSDAAYDYHRFWAGDLKRRGELTAAARHYEAANAAQPDALARRFQLAAVYERLGRLDDARRLYEEGLRFAPDDARGQRGLARLSRRP